MPIGLSQLPSGFTESLCSTATMAQSVRAMVSRKSALGFSSVMTKVAGSGAATCVTLRPMRPSNSGRQRQSVLASM